jgi:hypothetical protein
MSAIIKNGACRLPPWVVAPCDSQNFCAPTAGTWKNKMMGGAQRYQWPLLWRAEAEAFLNGYATIADYQTYLNTLSPVPIYAPAALNGNNKRVTVPQSVLLSLTSFGSEGSGFQVSDLDSLPSSYPTVFFSSLILGMPGSYSVAINPTTDLNGITLVPSFGVKTYADAVPLTVGKFQSNGTYQSTETTETVTSVVGEIAPSQWLGGDCLQIVYLDGGTFCTNAVSSVSSSTGYATGYTWQPLPNFSAAIEAALAQMVSVFRKYKLVVIYNDYASVGPGISQTGTAGEYDLPVLQAMGAEVHTITSYEPQDSDIVPVVENAVSSFYG